MNGKKSEPRKRTPDQLKKRANGNRLRRANRSPEEKENESIQRKIRYKQQTGDNRQREFIRRRLVSRNTNVETTNTNVNNFQQLTRTRIVTPESIYPARQPGNKPNVYYIGKKEAVCFICNALHFAAESTLRGKFSSCCGGGSIILAKFNDYPPELYLLLTGSHHDTKNFRNNIRKYNSAVAFASFGFQPIAKKHGPPVVIIHGQVYHKTSTSIATTENPSYAQLYFLDPEFATQHRINNPHNKDCLEHIMKYLDTFLREVNPFAAAYKMMNQVISSQPGNVDQIKMWITKDRHSDPRRYNLPIANEVAAVFVSQDGEPPFNRDICIHSNHNGLENIKTISPNCDPMIYPLLFPKGDAGWQPGIRKTTINSGGGEENTTQQKHKNVSMLEFYSFHLQDRGFFNPLLHAGKLTQQYMIDAFLKVEGERLEWNKQNQNTLRVELYLGLMDYINNQAEKQHLKPGRMVILPSSFYGGKRALQQNYQDAMAMVAKFGKPDLFITFTCNPKWKEIADNLETYETATDRPDLVATVFYLKLKEFMLDITNPHGGIFGKVVAYMSVIEFQKRGLPHCHLLLILADEAKIRTPEDVNTTVCAEIPNYDDEPLYEIVKNCMIHGPCGDLNKSSPCMDDVKGTRQCTKGYPKNFYEETVLNNDGYPNYRRRNDGKKISVRHYELDNRWVVPYNPYLSRKYTAHINVEVCSTVKSVKYIFKYIYKGHDAAIVRVNENGDGVYDWDEIKTYLDTRYIAAPEAIWRLRKYEMHSRSHAIERLPVHLPSQQTVVFREGEEEAHLRAAEKKGTKLTKWFQLNSHDTEARRYFYHEIPNHYVWKNNSWQTRKTGGNKILSRMYAVSPKDIERFCLRLLLLHVKGALSYEHLRTINGMEFETFKEAAVALNLLKDDQEWIKAMEEAANYRMPAELRNLFAAILTHGEVTDALSLYNKFKENMYEDYLLTHSEYMAEQLCLKDIQDNISQFGKTCDSYNLPSPRDAYRYDAAIDLEVERNESRRLESMMNAEQRTAFGIIMDAVNGKSSPKCFFLSGPGGCGKTFVYKALTSAIAANGGVVKAVAPTGLAATLLKGGKTVHTGFGISINLDENTTSRFKQTSPEFQELRKIRLIIWDEISMCHLHLLNAVDRSLRFLLNSDEPFGGIPIVVGGDFRQQAPVVLRGGRVQIVESCVKSSHIWKAFQELKLTRNMRVNKDEVDFSNWLLRIGSGINEDGHHDDYVCLPNDMLTNNIVSSVFGSNISALTPEQLASCAVLCPKNQDALAVNERVLSMLNGSEVTYLSVDEVEVDDEAEKEAYSTEFLNSLTPMGLPAHVLNLKQGCCVMLLRNLNPKRGLCNGTRLIVERLGTNIIECTIFSGDHRGERVLIPRVMLDSKGNELPFSLRRKQFPLRLAYSMTITKSQGQTFEKIGVLLPEPVFTHGQLYTAFSRVKSQHGLFVQLTPGLNQGKIFKNDSNIYTFNCVYREIL